MIVYEVTAVVADEIADEFRNFMQSQHISDLMATRCFESASLARADNNTFQMRYTAADRQTLDRYFTEHAEWLRADVTDRFPWGIQFSRQIWEMIAEF
jgi:hypothetical protein